MYVAADDTDSSTWMCTTFLATELVAAMGDLDLIGPPRLVRLNPAVPWKTRGNGAICLRVGRGAGLRRSIGRIGGREVFCYPRSTGEPDAGEVMERCSRVMDKWSQLDDSDPGLVISERRPDPGLYRRAVSRIITKEEALEAVRKVGGTTYQLNSGRGIIGAASAMSWVPMDRTYEVLTYRRRDRWGTPRDVSVEDVSLIDERFPSTFNNFDHHSGRPAIIPHTTCPILYGVRGDSAMELIEAYRSIASEEVERWMLFMTNQGTDEHIIRQWTALEANSSYEVVGTVAGMPHTVPGGHVIFRLASQGEEVDCAAYEPSKEYRQVARALRPGDRVRVLGELRETPRTLNIEKMEVLELAPSRLKVANPSCPQCGRRMKSVGAGQGYRCRECGTKKRDPVTEGEERSLKPGWYEPPVCSRRHLSMPLSRMGR